MKSEIIIPIILAISALLIYAGEAINKVWVLYAFLIVSLAIFLCCFVILIKQHKKVKIGRLSLYFLISDIIVFLGLLWVLRDCKGICGLIEALYFTFLMVAQICLLVYSGWLNYRLRVEKKK